MRATCNHQPRVMVPNGAKHKDGTPQLVCRACLSVWHQRHHRKKHGFGPMWDAQHGLCKFCGQPLADDNTTHWEHNHVTGAPRGLVHARCNQLISGIEDALAVVGWDKVRQYLQF